MKHLTALCALALLWASCGDSAKKDPETGLKDPIEIPFAFDTLLIEKEWGNCAKSEE
ncbi:MAG: hypothetical protein LPK45_10235 [Bacteroidota bacterium]|nr:hypothetical protein [Bacteroidota bacterium]MDX5431475.1 hypothetical protein [Bacteroidota bacterium]MDX5470199.1 hypothetical protein [Bacteroidota bacterium]